MVDHDELDRILRVINDSDLDRRSYIAVVGGGAVLDAVGLRGRRGPPGHPT